MYILSLECDNIYMFKNFRIDFTYGRKGKHFLSSDDLVFPDTTIYVRKKIVIMGGNATGKTTFGKLIGHIFLLLTGILGRVETKEYFENVRYIKKKPAWFYIELALDKKIYAVKVRYDKNGFIEEKVRVTNIQPKDSIGKARARLNKEDEIGFSRPKSYVVSDTSAGFVSHFSTDQNLARYEEIFARNFDFNLILSGINKEYQSILTNKSIKKLEKFLPKIDSSIKGVTEYSAKDVKTRTKLYTIDFRNGEKLAMDEKGKFIEPNRLSHGTYEALNIVAYLEYLQNNSHGGIRYLDEKMAHMHTELEKYLVFKMFNIARKEQLFITTHNIELLRLNLPSNAFMIFRRNNEGFNEVFFTNEKMDKNDRQLKNYYDNDYFGALPDYSELDKVFEEYICE